MSSLSRKKSVSGKKKEVERKRVVEEKAWKPTGTPPPAIVEVRHSGRIMQRQASGYSRGEVEEAGLNFGLARRWGLLVDDRRRSALEGNITSLKKWAPQTKKTTEKRVEGEVRKIEKVVAMEVRRAEKEVKKAEKEAERVEKEVVGKIEAPIKKRSKKKAAAKSETT